MKTQMNINLKKMALTAFAALVITVGSFEQPRTGSFNSEAIASLVNLESLMVLTEQNIRYIAPAAGETEADAFTAAQERLEMLTSATEASLRYDAPSVDALEQEGAAWERLELLAGATEATLQYSAPMVNDNYETEINPESEDEIMLADKTK